MSTLKDLLPSGGDLSPGKIKGARARRATLLINPRKKCRDVSRTCLSYVCVTQIRELLLGSVRNFRYHYFFWALSCYPKAKAKTLFAY